MTDRLRELELPADEGTLAERERRQRASAPTLPDFPGVAPAMILAVASGETNSSQADTGLRKERS